MTGDNDTITLKDAASHFGYTVSTLRAEASRGHLTIYKIGKRLYTTPADIREMVGKCRVEQKAQGFISILGDVPGSSVMDRVLSARAALRATLSAPASSLGGILPANTNPNRAQRR